MGWFQRLFAGAPPAPAGPPAPRRPSPNWFDFDGERLDLNTLTPEQLAKLEAVLLARSRQREAELEQYILSLAAERERLLAAGDYRLWLLTLKLMFGEELGHRVATQDVGAGMQLQHLILSLGQPNYVEATSAGVGLRYGTREAGSYFELEGATVVRAVLGTLPPAPLPGQLGPAASQ